MPAVDFGRDICGRLAGAESREWLCVNGIGGFASGTVAGLPTRRYHGLLVAALRPPLGRTVLVSRAEETAEYRGVRRGLHVNRWADGTVTPNGHHEVERFHLDGTTAVWTYALADARLEKRVGMEPGANTTYVVYHQGPTWGWLLGPFVLAHLRVHGDPAAARAFLSPMVHHVRDAGLGSVSEVFGGDAPFEPGGCPFQAWSVAETLRAWAATEPEPPSRAARPRGR